MKFVTVIGARPQFIKASVVIKEIINNGLEHILIHTGQHFDANMSDIFFEELDISKPDYNLGINGKSHGHMTGEMISSIEDILIKEKPSLVIVYGDTNSTLAAAISASKLHIPICHIEAGLRSFNNRMPEEINRILTDRISSFLFCPTVEAVHNLEKEGYKNIDCLIDNVGDVMLDAALHFRDKAKKRTLPITTDFILCTLHRAENTDDPTRLKNIISALNTISKKTTIICPLHPRTKALIDKLSIQISFKVIDPVGYLDMLNLIHNSMFVMTDSGGLQKESYFFNKRCIVLRDETEWVELTNAGINKLVGADEDLIIAEYENFISSVGIEQFENFYGNGTASKRIVEQLTHSLGNK
ncbi:non-hydrolyzing UDP-N-acetylglucosamine 2-epimerase [Bacteriovorax sp. Seq25_V]|uniref:non-hydrolyzing UDP-N-acetylglucosamine 2-epimerase n=1 Tax=Bacteriovorax sp. Seq25_V TaxID=1201288 RepID=UPI000389E8EC|nr:UDP-N-acetylglucosamine 2-epimerase (non-hydrolyzing) [Bacteriovorax sp. Seq25_V]EQC43416.1 UDP-N-acetylglucosamine 2-epimerase [Bacteriovorax sp. Seq25_V]